MKVESKKWIKILKEISTNPYKKILCPFSDEHFIHISIIPWPNEEQKVDVHLICEQCDIRNVFTKQVVTKNNDNLK